MVRKDRGQQGRLEEYMIKFDKYNASPSDDHCDLSSDFEFCMVVTDENTGDEKKHYFDDEDNVNAIIGNYKRISNENSKFTWKVFDKKGDFSTNWKEIM